GWSAQAPLIRTVSAALRRRHACRGKVPYHHRWGTWNRPVSATALGRLGAKVAVGDIDISVSRPLLRSSRPTARRPEPQDEQPMRPRGGDAKEPALGRVTGSST